MSEPCSTNFVIGISSTSGGGKTTLVKKAAELLDNAATLFLDDYDHEMVSPKDMDRWLKNGADMNEWKTPSFARDVRALRNGESVVSPVDGTPIQATKFIVIEEPSGRTRDEMAESIDFMVLIDTPLEIGFARRLLRSMENISFEGIEEATKEELAKAIKDIVEFLRGEASQFLDTWRAIYIEVQKQVEPSCDLILDGCLPVDELAKQLVEAVKKRRKSLA
ncbi:hypothetical protein ACFL6S_33135 [Candidatus Poribacteria bacterium]